MGDDEMNKINKEILYKMFHDGKDVSQMANAFNCTKHAVYYSLQTMGLKFRARPKNPEGVTMIAMTYAELEKLLPLVRGKRNFKHLTENLILRSGEVSRRKTVRI